MRLNRFLVVLLGASTLLSFTYGVLTGRYQIFPYGQLRAAKRLVLPVSSRDPGHDVYYFNKRSFFEQHGRQDYQVVFIGDSITDNAEWQELFPTLRIANRGIGGDGTDGVLLRLESICSTSAPKAFIMLGVNDLAAGMKVERILANYEKIVSRLLERNFEVYIQSTIFAGRQREHLNREIRALNEGLQALARRTEAVTYLDLNAQLAPHAFLEEKYSRDGLHLNGEGYAVWKEILHPHLPASEEIR